MSTQQAAAPMPVEIREYTPSANLMAISEQARSVARIDFGIARIFARATKVAAVKALMAQPEMMRIIDTLAGNPAGFYIGKDEKVTPAELASVVTEALSRGARLDGGEFTVLKGRAFLGKGYYQRQLDELGHETSYTEECNYRMMWWDRREVDVVNEKGMALVTIEVTYKLFDKRANKELDVKTEAMRVYIRSFPTDTPDKWVGQAERRVFQKLLRKLSNVDFGEDEDDGTVSARLEAPTPQVAGAKALSAPPAGAITDKTEIRAAIQPEVQDALKNLKGEATSTRGPAREEKPKEQPKAQAKEQTPYDRFYVAHTACKAKHGLAACKSIIDSAGFAGKSPSKLQPDELTTLAEQLENFTREPVPEADIKGEERAAAEAATEAAIEGAFDAAAPEPPKAGELF